MSTLDFFGAVQLEGLSTDPAPCGSAVQGAVLLSWMVVRHGRSMAYACSRLHILQNLNGCTRLFDDRGFDYDLYMHTSSYT